MQAQIKFGRIFGVQLGLHYSWLIIALLVMLLLAGQFHSTKPQWGESTIWVTAITAVLVMDVWEHAFLLDYKAAQRPKYIEAFLSNIDWRPSTALAKKYGHSALRENTFFRQSGSEEYI